MKKLNIAIILLLLIFLTVGCNGQNVIEDGEKPLIGKLTQKEEEEIWESVSEREEGPYLLPIVAEAFMHLEINKSDIARAIKLADEYGLDSFLPSPNTGLIYGELHVDDIVYFEEKDKEITQELAEFPFDMGAHPSPLRYRDLMDAGAVRQLMTLNDLAELSTRDYIDSLGLTSFSDVHFFTVPDIIVTYIKNVFTAPGVLVIKWSENASHEDYPIEDIKGDGNYYRYRAHSFFSIDENSETPVLNLKIDFDEGVENLGPDWSQNHMEYFRI